MLRLPSSSSSSSSIASSAASRIVNRTVPTAAAAGSSSSTSAAMLRCCCASMSNLRAPHQRQPSSSSFAAATAMTAITASATMAASARTFTSGPTPLRLRAKNPYKVLGVPQGASVKDIKKAYRVMAMKYHPDAPGGSHDKFQEIQFAYEQVKTGVYIPKEGAGTDGSNPVASRFGNFKYQTAAHSNVSFDQFMREMHAAENQGPAPDPEEQEQMKKKQKKTSPQDNRIKAWFRLLSLWAICFLTLRFALLLLFPPKVEHKKQRPKEVVQRHKAQPPAPARLHTQTA